MNNENIGIEEISYYLPKSIITSDELSDNYGYNKEFIETKVGVKKLFIEKELSTTDMAENVLEQLLSNKEHLRKKIELLVVCTQTPEYQLPQTSAQVQYRCGLNNSIASFDISLGCSGYVYGLSVIESLLVSLNLNYGVLITVEKYSSIIDDNDRNTKCLFSDASSATLLSRDGKLIPGKYKFGTDGEFYDSLIVRNKNSNNDRINNILSMNGREIFNFTVGKIPNEISDVCKLNDLREREIDHFVIHQASSFVISSIAARLEYDSIDKFANYMHIFGNTVSSSIPISLCKLTQDMDSIGNKILISGFGVGLSWGSVVLFNKGGFNYEK
jgi:3-oxoacyl-[acyl-carrier-protein] synthase III